MPDLQFQSYLRDTFIFLQSSYARKFQEESAFHLGTVSLERGTAQLHPKVDGTITLLSLNGGSDTCVYHIIGFIWEVEFMQEISKS